jgi:two-component system chemotaxis sensor kinase CheA
VAADPYRYFRVEARELVDGIAAGLAELERGTDDPAVLARLFRHAHTLKGAARVVRRVELAEHAHEFEEVLARARDAARAPNAAELGELFALVDRLTAGLVELETPTAAAAPATEAAPVAQASVPQAPPLEAAVQTVRIEVEEMDGVLSAVTETGVQLAALKRGLSRLHELVGVAAALASRSELGAASGRRTSTGNREHTLASELKTGLERAVQGLERDVERVEQELGDVRDGVDRLRLVPAETLFPALARAVHDAARALGRRAELTTTGGALRLDAHVLGPLRDALLHLVRNAVAHGVEPATERRAAGKPEVARVALGVVRRGDRVVFSCEDDGRGVDVAAIRRELVTRGLATSAETAALGDEAVLMRLFSARLSTTSQATQISGRGVGLDVVRETAVRLQGEVSIVSSPGRGTRIELAVPTTLAAVRALVLEGGGTSAVIPLDAVEQTLRIAPGMLARSPAGEAVALGDNVLPFVRLSRVLNLQQLDDGATACSAVIVNAGGRRAAVAVDRLLGAADVVVRPLPSAVRVEAVVAGASLDGEGNPRLVLDAEGLVAAASAVAVTAPPAPRERLPILVIDDSLTTRMLEQSILESAGYDVELAISAEEGLEKASRTRYALFVVDVEMPGMDGFEFVTRTRAHPELARIPAILVTSRAEPDDLARGERAGASAYIVKGEFDQNLLLANIQRLLGSH